MTIALRWRHFWARRSRARIALARSSLAGGLVLGAVAALPQTWRAQLFTAIGLTGEWIAAQRFDVSLVGAAAALCLICLLAVFAPLARRHPYWATPPSIVAPISVYLDLENQLSHAELRPFIAHLRKHLNGSRADLLYYTDAAVNAKGAMYREMWRFGFRPVDVPHKSLGAAHDNVRNAVDVELALHAHERGLLGPERQEIILVTADHDYRPLIYRLRAQGHRVSLWARALSQEYKDLAGYLGIEVFEFGSLFASGHTAAGSTATRPTSRDATAGAPRPATRAGEAAPSATFQPLGAPAKPISLDTVREAMTATLHVLDNTPVEKRTAEQRYITFKINLASRLHKILTPLGYEGRHRDSYWLAQLDAVGVLATDGARRLPSRGPVNPAEAAQHMDRFLRTLTARLTAMAGTDTQHRVALANLCDVMNASTTDSNAENLTGLHRLLTASADGSHLRHAQHLCRLARALRMIAFEEDSAAPGTLHVILPHVGETGHGASLADAPDMR